MENTTGYFAVRYEEPLKGLCEVFPQGEDLKDCFDWAANRIAGNTYICIKAPQIAAAVAGFCDIRDNNIDPNYAEHLIDELDFWPKTPKADKWKAKFLDLCTQFYEKSLELAAEYEKDAPALEQEAKAAIKEMNEVYDAYGKGLIQQPQTVIERQRANAAAV